VRSRLTRAASITARAGLLLTLLGALSLLLSGAGSRWDWWDFRTGFAIFRWTLYGGLGAVVVSLAGLVLALVGRAHNTALLSIGTLVLLAAIAVVPVSHLRNAGQVPPIHDISTDLDDPPRFVAVLPLRQGAPNTVEYGGPALAAQQRATIDAAFAAMAEDSTYHTEAQALTEAFAQADWEALQMAEGTAP